MNPSLYMELFGAIMLLIVNANHSQYGKSTIARTHFALVNLVLFTLILEGAAWYLDGAMFPYAGELLLIMNTAYYILQILFCPLWLRFSYMWFNGGKAPDRRYLYYCIPAIIELAIILINVKTGWIFTMSELNVYTRGQFYTINLIPYYFYILMAAIVTIKNAVKAKDVKNVQDSILFAVYMILPIAGTVLESIFFGVSWLWPMCSLTLLMIGNTIKRRRLEEEFLRAQAASETAAKLRSELVESQVSIMLSQIQPHFLYNALSTIRELCRIDPKSAERAVISFTDFLRGNMDSLSAAKSIPFEQELKHTRDYIAIEKYRFGDNLSVVYDIQTINFKLPTLTLQPIVENAVRHGVTKREEGGLITIATRETPETYIVRVHDDGVGFDTTVPKRDGRAHIGLLNVTDRLKRVMGGTLTVESEKNIGTTVTIELPKTLP